MRPRPGGAKLVLHVLYSPHQGLPAFGGPSDVSAASVQDDRATRLPVRVVRRGSLAIRGRLAIACPRGSVTPGASNPSEPRSPIRTGPAIRSCQPLGRLGMLWPVDFLTRLDDRSGDRDVDLERAGHGPEGAPRDAGRPQRRPTRLRDRRGSGPPPQGPQRGPGSPLSPPGALVRPGRDVPEEAAR